MSHGSQRKAVRVAALSLSVIVMGRTLWVPRPAYALPSSPQAVPEDSPLQRSPNNPLLSRGPAGSFDQVKIGPRAMLREGPNAWKLWYEGVPGGNTSRVGYATSPDGVTWTKYSANPVMVPTEAWEGAPAGETSPTTVLREHGVYEMWYHGFQDRVRRIGYATSTDGITWTKYPGNPVLVPGPPGAWDQGSVAEPHVVKVGAVYYMFYAHAQDPQGVGLATSSDGIHWMKYAGNPVLTKGTVGAWDDKAMQGGGVVYDGRAFHMWFRGYNTNFATALGYAWSLDGMSWTKSPKNPLLTKPNPALGKGDDYGVEGNTNIFRRGAQWWIYYGGFVSCCPENMGFNLATSAVMGARNLAPVVDAGADQTIVLPAAATVAATVMDDDVPVALENVKTDWSMWSGPGAATFAEPNALTTTIAFSQPGTYVLRLSADDGELSAFDDVTVLVLGATPTATATLEAPTRTATRTQAPTQTQTRTPIVLTATPTASVTYTPIVLTPTPTSTVAPTGTPVVVTPTTTASATGTQIVSTPTPTVTRTGTPIVVPPTATASATNTRTVTPTDTSLVATRTPTASVTSTPIVLTPTLTMAPTATPIVVTPTPTVSVTATPIVLTPTPAAPPTDSPTQTPTASATGTAGVQSPDVNCDDRVSAADVTAFIRASGVAAPLFCGNEPVAPPEDLGRVIQAIFTRALGSD